MWTTVCGGRPGEEPETDFMSTCIALNRLIRSPPRFPHLSTSDYTQKDLTFQVIERCPSLSDTEETSRCRKRRELFWIWLKSITPAGINHMV
jgi:hypothetical protein